MVTVINEFPEFQDVVDIVVGLIGCRRLRIIQKGSRLVKNHAVVEEGKVIMSSGLGKDDFGSVLVEEICHVCIAPGANKEKIVEALIAKFGCNGDEAGFTGMIACDIVCENRIFRNSVLNQLRQPKIRSFLSTLDASLSLREVQAIFAQLRGLDFSHRSPLWKDVKKVLESASDVPTQCIRVAILLFPTFHREFEELRKARAAQSRRNI